MSVAQSSGQSWEPVADVRTARLRAEMLQRARRFFAARDILLVDTPMLGAAAVSDPNIESIAATVRTGHRRDRFLHTSPEYNMKRLLAAGFPDIAQICRVFRDGESGRRHQPEFTMAEWYRLAFDLPAMMTDTEEFLLELMPNLRAEPPVRYSYRDAFITHLGIDPLVASTDELQQSEWADDGLRETLADDRDAWLDLLMASQVSVNFDPERLTAVYHYPASQAALAQLDPAQPELAERFEIYLGDLELANGYVELTDAPELAARFERDQSIRHHRRQTTRPLDVDFLAAMSAGLPACAGVAVGLDRVLMASMGETDIQRVVHFPDRAQP